MADTDDSSEPTEQQVKTILVVDDDETVGEFIITALTTETAYLPLLVTDGAQALEVIKTLVPHLFVLDYNLPGINGLELADLLKATESFAQTPILLMSAHLPKQELTKRDLASIEKPFELDTLLQLIETLLTQ